MELKPKIHENENIKLIPSSCLREDEILLYSVPKVEEAAVSNLKPN